MIHALFGISVGVLGGSMSQVSAVSSLGQGVVNVLLVEGDEDHAAVIQRTFNPPRGYGRSGAIDAAYPIQTVGAGRK